MSETANDAAPEAPQGTTEGDNGEATETQTPTVEDLLKKVEELTTHSRKWEGRAKENFEAKKELDALRESQMSEAEKAEKASQETAQRLQDAEDRASKAEAELARYKVATEFRLSPEDAEALASIADETTLRALAERLAGRSNPGPRPNPSQGERRGSTAPSTTGEKFAEAVGHLFN